MEFAPAREFVELMRAIRSDDADRADPAATIRLACDPVEVHRQFAFFEGARSKRRTAEYGYGAGQSDAKGGGAKKHPAAKIKRSHKPQFGSFPKPRTRTVATAKLQRHMILSHRRYEKVTPVDPSVY